MTYLRKKVDDITAETGKQEQQSRRNCLLIHSIPENKDEDTYVLALEVIDTKMEIKTPQNDIDKTHSISIQKSLTTFRMKK